MSKKSSVLLRVSSWLVLLSVILFISALVIITDGTKPVRLAFWNLSCVRLGKTMLTTCRGEAFQCAEKFADAGTPCTLETDSCMGFCVKRTATTGTCSAFPGPRQQYDQFRDEPYEVPLTDESLGIHIERPCTIR